jgi:anti-sigma factor RsiW
MCEYSGRLIAWLDREVPAEEATALERHLGACAACREEMIIYRRMNADVKAYCHAVMEAKVRRPALTWLVAASGTAAIAAALVLAVSDVFPRGGVAPAPGPALSEAAVAPVQRNEPAVLETPRPRKAREARAVPGELVKRIHPRQPASPLPPADVNWIPAESVIEIVIPAEAVFPLGAVPEGVSFNADLTIGADGYARGLWWRP